MVSSHLVDPWPSLVCAVALPRAAPLDAVRITLAYAQVAHTSNLVCHKSLNPGVGYRCRFRRPRCGSRRDRCDSARPTTFCSGRVCVLRLPSYALGSRGVFVRWIIRMNPMHDLLAPYAIAMIQQGLESLTPHSSGPESAAAADPVR